MVEVRVRHVDNELGQVMGHFHPSELDDVVTIFQRVNTISYGYVDYGPAKFHATQFVFDGGEAFFEIVVSDG